MKQVTTAAGLVLTGRPAELYTGDCPPERPCNQADVANYRSYYDGMKPMDQQAASQVVPQDPNSRPNRLWKFAGRLYSFLEAQARWYAAGCPVTPPDVLAERERLCFACEHHGIRRGLGKDSCGVCGCGELGGSLALKRSYFSEECSADPPRWLAGECFRESLK